MAEQRQKTHAVLLRTGGKICSLELFDAALWPDQAGDDGLWRVRVDDVWHTGADKYTFLTLPAVGGLVAAHLVRMAGQGDASAAQDMPWLPYKARVRVHLADELSPQGGSVHAPPHKEEDGRWWVWVWIFGRGPVRVPCNDVTLVRVM